MGVNLSNLDLNLLVVLDAVLTEQSATRAAARLHVTQSAVSNALARLRAVLGDPLVVRTRRGLAPTPHAVELQPRLRAALEALEGVTRDAAPFDLATTTREWGLAFADVHGVILLPKLVDRLRREAPHASLRVVTLDRMFATSALAEGGVDLYVGIPGVPMPGCHSQPLFEDELVCILRRDHSSARKPLTLARFVELPHVQLKIVPTRGREIDEALAREGLTRHTVLTVPSFAAVPAIVATTDCVAALSRRQAEYYAQTLPLRILPIPLELPRVKVSLHWHKRVARDPAVQALRGMVTEIFAGK